MSSPQGGGLPLHRAPRGQIPHCTLRVKFGPQGAEHACTVPQGRGQGEVRSLGHGQGNVVQWGHRGAYCRTMGTRAQGGALALIQIG